MIQTNYLAYSRLECLELKLYRLNQLDISKVVNVEGHVEKWQLSLEYVAFIADSLRDAVLLCSIYPK